MRLPRESRQACSVWQGYHRAGAVRADAPLQRQHPARPFSLRSLLVAPLTMIRDLNCFWFLRLTRPPVHRRFCRPSGLNLIEPVDDYDSSGLLRSRSNRSSRRRRLHLLFIQSDLLRCSRESILPVATGRGGVFRPNEDSTFAYYSKRLSAVRRSRTRSPFARGPSPFLDYTSAPFNSAAADSIKPMTLVLFLRGASLPKVGLAH